MMFKVFKSPEKLFSFSMWLVSLLFASFLIGLGGKVIADLPSVGTRVSRDQFTNQAALQAGQSAYDGAQTELRRLRPLLVEAKGQLTARQSAYATAQSANRNWLATRSVTTSNLNASAQDPELLRQTQELEKLSEAVRAAQVDVEQLDAQVRAADRTSAQALESMDGQRNQANPAYLQSVRAQELRVFGYRLALTLPLLGIAGWLVTKKRKSSHWPLARGFVLFAAFAFFVELVPYLPSYGGYVRYGVGIALSLVGGHYGINWMRAYLARRSADALRNETERRSSLDEVMAIQKIAAKLCPGCERGIPPEVDGVKVNNCVYCGLKLFDFCKSQPDGSPACGVRKNAFFHYCPSCGVAPKAVHGRVDAALATA